MTTPSLQTGDKAPSFKLIGDDDKFHELADFKNKVVVLYFYPKDETPGCTTEACDFRDAWSEFRKLDVVVIGVSPDSPESHREFKANHNLPFLLLCDPDYAIAKVYGAFGEKNMYGKISQGLIRSTFIIGKDGTIAARFGKVSVAGHVEKVLKSIG